MCSCIPHNANRAKYRADNSAFQEVAGWKTKYGSVFSRVHQHCGHSENRFARSDNHDTIEASDDQKKGILMSMPVDLPEKHQEVVVRARADLIGHLAYIDITDIFAIDDEDLLYRALNDKNVRQRILGEMSRDDLLSHCLSTAVAHAARILAPEDFREMVAECTKIACGASSECYAVDPDVLTLLIYDDAQKHAPTEEISKEYCPWWEENDSVFSANETAKIISGAAQTNVIASPRESASVVPHRQTGRSDSSGGDGDGGNGGDGEPPRPRSPHSPTTPLRHSLTRSLIIAGGAQ
jgi:hypothetical protein